MDVEKLKQAVEDIKNKSKVRKFKQSVDLVITFKKTGPKEVINVDTLLSLPNTVKESKTCAFVDKDLIVKAKDVFDKTIERSEFDQYDKKKIKKLVRMYDFFLGEMTIMPQIAAKFGKQLTAMDKMPNPKTGTIISPESDLKAINEKLKRSFRVKNGKNLAISVKVGNADMDSQKLIDNIMYVYNAIKALLPSAENNIKRVYLKTTMGKPLLI